LKTTQKLTAAAVIIWLCIQPFFAVCAAEAAPPDTASQAVCVMDTGTGIVLYAENADARMYPASVTKVMTALLLMEYANGNWEERVTFSANAVFGIERGSSHISMDVDETLTLTECLYAMMLASANEVCMAVAEHIAESVDAFADMMNARAQELGCTGTQFKNPHGLPDSEHYTTARDIAIIMREAVKHDFFREVITTVSYQIPPTEKQPEVRNLWNSNKMILPGSFFSEWNSGGKTGYTDDARHTFVSLNEKDGASLVCAVMKSEKNEIYKDTAALANYGFTRYRETEVLALDGYVEAVDVTQMRDGAAVVIGTVQAVPDRAVVLRLPIAASGTEIVKTPSFAADVQAPVQAGEIVGSLTLHYAGAEIDVVNLVAAEGIEALDATTLTHKLEELSPAFGGTDRSTDIEAEREGGFPIFRAALYAVIVLAGLGAVLLSLQMVQWRRDRRARYRRRRGGAIHARRPAPRPSVGRTGNRRINTPHAVKRWEDRRYD